MISKDKVKHLSRNILMRIFAIRRANKKSAFFISFSGKQYSDSPKAISEYLHRLDPSIEIVWMVDPLARKGMPRYIKCVAPSSIDAIKEQARSVVWVSNTTIASGTFKPKGTYYIQTWHGDRGFKLCGYDAAKVMKTNYSKSKKLFVENELCDLYLVGSQFGEKVGRSALGYNGEFLKTGIPRNDILIDYQNQSEGIKRIKKNIGIEGKKILLYAPTFRDKNRSDQIADVNLSDCLDVLSQTGEDWVCLLRGHSATKHLKTMNDDERVLDVSDYPDMADLLLISDMEITDYSSSISDFILTARPSILAQFDRNKFEEENRTLYFNPDDSGYPVAHSQQELTNILKHIDEIDFKDVREKVNEFYGTYETGKATEEVCDRILREIKA